MVNVTRWAWGTFATLSVLLLGTGAFWLAQQHSSAKNLAAADLLAAIDQTNSTLDDGPSPTAWPTRLFLPTSMLASATSILAGAQVIVPMGPQVEGHVDGYIRISVKSAELVPGDVKIGARLSATVSYEPDRKNPWWGGARGDVLINGIMVPKARTESDGIIVTQFGIVPDSIAAVGDLSFLELRVQGLLGVVLADQTMLRLADRLTVPLPAPAIPIDINPSVDTSSFQGFGGGGGTNILLKLDRPKQNEKISLDRWLATRSGIWLLGGKPSRTFFEPPGRSTPSVIELEGLRSKLTARLAPFQRSDRVVEAVLPASKLTGFIDRLLSPVPLTINLSTTDTSGTLVNGVVLRNDKILGDIGILVNPRTVDPARGFGYGEIVVHPGAAMWSGQSGLSLGADVTAHVTLHLDLHLATGIGGGIGTPVDIIADGKTHMTLAASFQKQTLPSGSAIVLQPTVPCAQAVIRVQSGAAPVFPGNWIVMSPLGGEFDTELGGAQIAPAVLIDSLPMLIAAPIDKDADGKVLERSPRKSIIRFAHSFVSLTLMPDSVVTDTSSVTVRAVVAAIEARDQGETATEKAQRSDFRHALTDLVPNAACKPITGAGITIGDVKVSDVYKEMQYIVESYKDQVKVADDVWKALTTLNPGYTAANLGKALNDEVKAGTSTFQHSITTIVDTAKATGQVLNQANNALIRKPAQWMSKRISDQRLKDGIVEVGSLPNGIGLYRFHYLWDDQLYVGVMAQEVRLLVPDAVSRDPSGYLLVDYDRVGFKMQTWDEWVVAHRRASIPP